MTNYWDFDNDFYDKIGKLNLYNVVNVSFASDRYGRPNSAVFLNNGSMQAPSGVYFSGPLTITFWIYSTINVSNYIISFTGDSKYPSMAFYVSITPLTHLDFNNNGISCQQYPAQPKLFVWTHVTLIHDGTNSRIYYNGTIKSIKNCTSLPTNSLKYSNYIGNPGYFILDELKFFNRVMNTTEIQNDIKSL